MKCLQTLLLWVVFVPAILASVAPTESERLEEIKKELRERRQLREQAVGAAGAAYMPLAVPVSWYADSFRLEFKKESIRYSGQLFATLTKKEVLISGAVAKRCFTLVADAASSKEAELKLREAYAQSGIRIIEIGESLLVLADAETRR